MPTSGDRLAAIIGRYDTALSGAEAATISRVNAALESSYLRLERRLLDSYETHASNLDLLPNQRKLLVMDEVSSLLQLINPRQAEQIQASFEGLLRTSDQYGRSMAADLVRAIANEKVQSFAAVPLEAVRFQAQDGLRRLSRHSEEFASRASGVVEMGLVQGWGGRKVATELRRELGTTKGKAEAIARTESVSALDSAARATYQRNGIFYVQRIATQDARVCPTCAARAGRVYRLEEAPSVLHPRDRCYNLPYKPEWVQAGLIDEQWIVDHAEAVQAEVLNRGEKLNFGLAPFEKANRLEKPPEAIWQPTINRRQARLLGDGTYLPEGSQVARPGIHTALIERGRAAVGTDLIQQLEEAIAGGARVASLKAEIARLEPEFDKLFDKDPSAAFRSDIGKRLTELDKQLKEAVAGAESAAELTMAQIRAKLKILSRAEAEALAGRAKVLKSAANYAGEAKLRTQLADVYEITGGKGSDRLKKIKLTNARAHAEPEGALNIGRNLSWEQERIFWHEMGHFVEYESEEIRAALESWVRARATGGFQHLNAITGQSTWDNDEFAWPGTFVDPYVGRIYIDGATEVLSMGLQYFVNPSDMLKLYKGDREHFFLTIGALR